MINYRRESIKARGNRQIYSLLIYIPSLEQFIAPIASRNAEDIGRSVEAFEARLARHVSNPSCLAPRKRRRNVLSRNTASPDAHEIPPHLGEPAGDLRGISVAFF